MSSDFTKLNKYVNCRTASQRSDQQTATRFPGPLRKRYVSLMNRAILILATILASTQVTASDQTQMAFTSMVFNYWCQAGSPPGHSRDLSLVVDLEELDAFLDFDPDHWIQSARFEMEGNVQKIIFPAEENTEGGSTTTNSSYSTHECGHSEET